MEAGISYQGGHDIDIKIMRFGHFIQTMSGMANVVACQGNKFKVFCGYCFCLKYQ